VIALNTGLLAPAAFVGISDLGGSGVVGLVVDVDGVIGLIRQVTLELLGGIELRLRVPSAR